MFLRYAGLPLFNHSLLTYMSTHAILKESITKGILCHLAPSLGGPIARPMLIHEELASLFAIHSGKRPIGAMKGYLDSIVGGSRVIMSFTPYNHGPSTMGLLDPPADGTWEIRCRDPSPATRVLGRFVCQNVFVALDWAPRSKKISGIDKEPLGDTGSFEWEVALGEVAKRWAQIAPGITPLIGDSVSDYFTENADQSGD
jgi:hypothetical protein